MTALLTATPNPVPSGGTSVDVDATGLEARPTRFLVDGAEILASFLPSGGAFSTTITASTTVTTQHLVVEQCSSGAWLPVATATLTIEDVPPVDAPFTDLTGWELRFADYFDRVIAEGDFLDGADFAPPGAAGAKTADGRYLVFKDGWKDTSQHGRYDPSIIATDGSQMLIHVQTRDGYPRVAALTPLPSGSSPKGGLLGMRTSITSWADSMADYKGIGNILWSDLATSNESLLELGEIDWGEGDFDDVIHGFMHRTGASSYSDQYVAIPSPDDVSWQDEHEFVVEWVAGTSCKFLLDGTQIGTTQTSRVPNSAMHVNAQIETALGGAPIPSPAVTGFVSLKRRGVWAVAP